MTLGLCMHVHCMRIYSFLCVTMDRMYYSIHICGGHRKTLSVCLSCSHYLVQDFMFLLPVYVRIIGQVASRKSSITQ